MPSIVDCRGGAQSRTLNSISNRNTAPPTTVTFKVAAHALVVDINANDPDMSALVATMPRAEPDAFLFEEDGIQLTIWFPGTNNPEMQVINPLGKRSGSPEAVAWGVTCTRHADSWEMAISVPLPAETEAIGISVHRFFRGCLHAVSSLASNLPYPIALDRLSVLLVAGSSPASELANEIIEQASTTEQSQLAQTLNSARQRLAAHPEQLPNVLDDAMVLAEQRCTRDIKPDERFLAWNEGYFQHALMDLFDLTDNRRWLDMAIARMELVWAMRADQRGVVDRLRQRTVPTWLNDSETDAACTLASGVILFPISRALKAMHERHELGLADVYERWLPWAQAVLDLHDPEWLELPDGSGMHLEPHFKGPRRVYATGGSRINPLNREFWFSLPMLNITDITDNAEYRRKVEMNARYFRRVCELAEDGAWQWEYQEGVVPNVGEDIAHAHSQVLFAMACHEHGIEFTEADLRAMATTLKKRVFRHGDVPCEMIRGHVPTLLAAVISWSPLCRYAPEVLPKIGRVMATLRAENDVAFSNGQGWGIRLLTMFERARRELAG